MSAFYNSQDFTPSLEASFWREMRSENHNALRKDLAQGLCVLIYTTKELCVI